MDSEDLVSKKRKNKSRSEEETVKPEEKQVDKEKPVYIPKMTFSAWFQGKVKKRKLKYWQEAALEVFMQKQGLSILEAEDKYDEAFKRF